MTTKKQPPERQIPPACPGCRLPLAHDYKQHCPDRWCGWVICGSCNAVVDTQSGNHYVPPPTPEGNAA